MGVLMVTCEGKRICDREIWSRNHKRWESCKKPATVVVESKCVPYMQMDFCGERHLSAYLEDA